MDEMEKGKKACYNQIGEEKATILVPVAQHSVSKDKCCPSQSQS